MSTRFIVSSLVGASLCSVVFASTAPVSGKNSPSAQTDRLQTKPITAKLDLNQASAIQIANAINGIGKKRAQAIVDYRKQFGNFKTFGELSKVRGISQKFMTKELHQFDEKFYLAKVKKS